MAIFDLTFGTMNVQYNTSINKSRLKPRATGAQIVADYERKHAKAFELLDAVNLTNSTVSPVRRDRKALKIYEGVDHIITTLNIADVIVPKHELIVHKPRIRMEKKVKHSIVHRPVRASTKCMESLLGFLANRVRLDKLVVEIVGNTRRVAKFKRATSKTTREFTVVTRHQLKEFRGVDVVRGPIVRQFEQILVRHSSKKGVNTSDLTYGDSGLLIKHDRLTGIYAKHPSGLLIVRGKLDGKVLDSRIRQSTKIIQRIAHYSGNVAERFWRGFERTFCEFRPRDIDHACTSDFDVEACGSVAAIVCQTIMPCGKITCKQCASNSSQQTITERREQLEQVFERNTHYLTRGYGQFVNATTFLDSYKKVLSSVNRNYETFAAIHRMIGDRQDAPFSHINRINEVLIKGGHATNVEFEMMTNSLHELARYQKNRTENIKAGSLQSFRNKASGKAHLNPALMCDNQLDVNGNFVWGLRGKHAKRFFSNYFDEIDPMLGYDKYTIRENPNGARKLAIGNLIVSTNFEALREQLKGEPITPVPVTQQCVSRRNGNFEYPCCCVTLEDGKPFESEIKMPTKNHLVIGNTGDSKYVDLPTDISAKMYIAKQGYCYINIFLAMLVNVNEADAKDFTKMVRDIVMDRLGKWPSLMDVATACFLLRTFFPDIHNAELPRILVDHTTKTMHVIDSFGSISTGYHVLKANTVNQLILFANNQLESEMKHYIVGGNVEVAQVEMSNVKLLARSVYRPRLMRELLSEEPYIILLSVLSPGILMALYNSGSFERMTHELIHQDSNLATISSLLSALALKVSLSDTLTIQLNTINAHASILLDVARNGPQTLHSRNFAVMTLERIQARNDTEQSLMEIGFMLMASRTNNQALMEKIYLQELEASWQDLKWSEKYYAIRESYRWRRHIPNVLHPTSTADFNGRYNTSVRSLLVLPLKRARSAMNSLAQRAQRAIAALTARTFNNFLSLINQLIPDIFKFINVLIVISLLLQITVSIRHMLEQHRQARQAEEQLREYEQGTRIVKIYKSLYAKLGEHPTKDEFVEYITAVNPGLVEQSLRMIEFADDVKHQAKRESQANLERIVAFVSLVLMLFDAERSDCVYRILNKLKGLVGTLEVDVYHQSIDDIQDVLEEKKQTVDFEVSVGPKTSTPAVDTTFKKWWDNQLEVNNIIPHYRTEGHYMEFTRATTALVANNIAHGPHVDILVRGGVGSGKSTGLPHSLSAKGRVLMIEPTRPLAENVCKQLRGDPFHVNATLRMRGLTTFGSDPITIMTSGFALHYYANNPLQLEDYKFVLFDECHVNDSSAMAFRCLLHEYKFPGKVIKVSATPPGREKEEATLCKLHVRSEETLSFQQFVSAQGTGSNADVVSHGDNILVYVASYNDVDTLSGMLLDKGYKVTKVDGRTMKVGNVEITTSGTPQKKHFIVATNIIENGVTLDIDVVVDFGLKVVPILDIDNRLVRYSKISVSYGERIQRIGRVARFKEGHALRIGHTEKGLVEIPTLVATEAAFLSFAYGLPVMTHNVSTALLSGCTVRQARTMLNFELPHLYMVNLVRYDGSMHPAIHTLLKSYRLRDSEVLLNKMAIPYSDVPNWISAKEYARMGCITELERDAKIPFYMREIPERLHEQIWGAVTQYKGDAGFGRLRSINCCKIAYTLQTNVFAVQSTLAIIDELLAKEMEKQAHFRTVIGNNCSSSDFTLSGIAASIRARYSRDYTSENISILQAAKAQLREFENLHLDVNFQTVGTSNLADVIREYGALECVFHQSSNEMARHLKLKGQWNGSLITRDILVLAGVVGGGVWMLYEYFKEKFYEPVYHQGYNKRQRQKLKFRNAREAKLGREVAGDDGTIEHYFGAAYTKKGKVSGRKHGMGVKSRRFVNMYGYDPADYSFVRFVDPLTGHTIDDSPYTDISLIQEQFSDARIKKLMDGELERGHIERNARIEAYYIKDFTKQALKVDLTPHNPLLMCERANTIAGFPEREFELRQTGKPTLVSSTSIPEKNEIPDEEAVDHESESTFKGMRDYNPIASAICCLTNESDGHNEKLFGLGFGALIITNQHLFKRNNGMLRIKSKHGEFTIPNTQQLQVLPSKGRDLIVIRLPKDFPPFPQRLKFRAPKSDERICMVGTLFQDKSMTSTVSETSATYARPPGHFWKHWISTKDGYCGLPLVSTTDGSVVGLHSLSNFTHTHQYYTAFPDNFSEDYLMNPEQQEWVRHWKYNVNEICWGSLNLRANPPNGLFKVQKLVSDLCDTDVYTQSKSDRWVYDAVQGNLKAVATCPSQLVTKHVVKGKCVLFETYLQTHPEESKFFEPLLNAYQKSRLNRDAYLKDVLKYSTPIEIGSVECSIFEQAFEDTVQLLQNLNFGTCVYVTDTESIFAALNMKSAVGALYSGKKKDYFREFSDENKDQIVRDSCYRLYRGWMGVWNGSLKAELRPAEKVQENKTRTFTAAPLDTLLGGKVCVDDFNNRFYSLNLEGPWSVGMTKFYGGWDKLLTQLPDGWVYCDADGSQFDSSLSPYLINAVLRLRLRFMEHWDIGEMMLQNLYTEIVYTPISAPDGTILKKFKGNNSGQPSTVVDNTLMVVLAMQYSLLKLGIQHSEQDKVCKYFVNGDDLLIAVRQDMQHILDTFSESFRTLGLKYDFSSRHTDKTKLWFMSHQGKLVDGQFIPKLEQERIVAILQWDKAVEPAHRLEAICAAMIESWGHWELTHQIRKFYQWVLEQAPYSELAREGKAPYIAEIALRKLYTDQEPNQDELLQYLNAFNNTDTLETEIEDVFHQSQEEIDAGRERERRSKQQQESPITTRIPDRDVNVGTSGGNQVPRIKQITAKLALPKVKGKVVMNLEHLLIYNPSQVDISNTRATQSQFETWYEGVKNDYATDDGGMSVLLNGLMVWCIENGTSPNVNGMWVMMDGDEQVEYPIKPLIDHAKPTFRQIMAHFSNVAEAYIEKRNYEKPYMPRYGLQRNLNDMSLARYAFDFYELTSKTPARAREAHMQMKAAALRNTSTRLFGLDGNVATREEDTERHTADDINRSMHSLNGSRSY